MLLREIRDRRTDDNGNPYHNHEKCYTKLANNDNYNWEFDNVILKKLILPGCGVSPNGTCDHRVGILWD